MNEKAPIVSVIIPTHNRAHLLGRAINSVLSQTFQDFEILLIDDGSTDNTREIVAQVGDQRIFYIRRGEENSGASAARNTGILQAKGKYISFLDDDDEYLPEFLEEMCRVFDAAPDNTGFVWSGVQFVQDTPQGEVFLTNNVWQPQFKNQEQGRSSFFQSGVRTGTGNGLAVRAACFDTVGLFDETLGSFVDTDLLFRLGSHYNFAVIPQILVKRHLHDGFQLTNPTPQRIEAIKQVMRKHSKLLDEYPGLWIDLHFQIGSLCYKSGDKAQGRKWMFKIIRKDPFHLRTWLRILRFEVFGVWSPHLYQKTSVWRVGILRYCK